MDGHRCFGLASMYNLVPRLSQEKVDGPTTHWEGENLDVHQKKSLKNLQILKFGIEEVDQGEISTTFFSVSSSFFALMKGFNALFQPHYIQSGNFALTCLITNFRVHLPH